jgi:undecaprenyl diphosphate synthase
MEMARYIFEEGIDTLTLFLFSTENWRRPIGEIQNIMELLEEYLTTFSGYLVDNNIRVEVIGQVKHHSYLQSLLTKFII